MTESDSSTACILRLALCLGFGGHGLAVAAQWRPPRSRFEASVRTWVLGRRGAGRATPFRHGSCCLRLEGRSRHSECFLFRRSLALPAHAATDASPVPSRERPHGSRKNVYRCILRSGRLALPTSYQLAWRTPRADPDVRANASGSSLGSGGAPQGAVSARSAVTRGIRFRARPVRFPSSLPSGPVLRSSDSAAASQPPCSPLSSLL